jgi:hypothetical protein
LGDTLVALVVVLVMRAERERNEAAFSGKRAPLGYKRAKKL